MPRLAQSRYGLDPAKDFFDSFPFALTDHVTFVPRGAGIDRAASPRMFMLCHVRRHRRLFQFGHEVFGVVVLVSAQRHPPRATRNARRHPQGRIAFRRARGPRQLRIQ